MLTTRVTTNDEQNCLDDKMVYTNDYDQPARTLP